MRLVFVLIATAVTALSEASGDATRESDSFYLLLAVFLLIPLLVLAVCCFAYLAFFRARRQPPVAPEESPARSAENDVEAIEQESPSSRKPRLVEVNRYVHFYQKKRGSKKLSEADAGTKGAVCPSCSRSSSESNLEKFELNPPSYAETMQSKRVQEAPKPAKVVFLPESSALQKSTVDANPVSNLPKTLPQVQQIPENPPEKLPPKPVQPIQHNDNLSGRRLSLSTDDSADFDDSLVVNTMRSEDMIRPNKPIYSACVRPPPVSAEAITELSTSRSTSETRENTNTRNPVKNVVVPRPKMIQVGYPTAPKYTSPMGSSESIASALSKRKTGSDSNIMYSQEHLIDYSKKDGEKPETSATQATLAMMSIPSTTIAATQATKTTTASVAKPTDSLVSNAAPTQTSSVLESGTQATTSRAGSDILSTKTAVEEVSESSEHSSKSNEKQKKGQPATQ